MVFGGGAKPTYTLYQAQRWVYEKLMQGGEFGKQVQPQTIIAETTVNGERALWFSGAPHVVMMLDERGNPIYETQRTVDANTLVWETSEVPDSPIYRLETMGTLEDAVKIAESLVPVE